MALDEATVRSIAKLARIRVADDDLPGLANELNNILGWIEQLNEVDTDGVEPLTVVGDAQTPMRQDVVNDGDIRDDVLANAPDAEPEFFTVPKVVE